MDRLSQMILANPQPTRGGLTIYVPPGVDARPKVGECYLCNAEFREGDNIVRHMKSCVSDAGHDHRAEREAKKDRMEIFMDPNAWNPDVDAYLKTVGKRMLKEGRWEMRPNERIHNE